MERKLTRFSFDNGSICSIILSMTDKDAFDFIVIGGGVVERTMEQGAANGASGLRMIDGRELHEIVPAVLGSFALLSSSSGIIDPFLLTIHLAENAAAIVTALILFCIFVYIFMLRRFSVLLIYLFSCHNSLFRS